MCHRSKLCVTEVNYVSRNSILSYRSRLIQFRLTKVNSVAQIVTKVDDVSRNSIPSNDIKFCVTEVNFVEETSILFTKLKNPNMSM